MQHFHTHQIVLPSSAIKSEDLQIQITFSKDVQPGTIQHADSSSGVYFSVNQKGEKVTIEKNNSVGKNNILSRLHLVVNENDRVEFLKMDNMLKGRTLDVTIDGNINEGYSVLDPQKDVVTDKSRSVTRKIFNVMFRDCSSMYRFRLHNQCSASVHVNGNSLNLEYDENTPEGEEVKSQFGHAVSINNEGSKFNNQEGQAPEFKTNVTSCNKLLLLTNNTTASKGLELSDDNCIESVHVGIDSRNNILSLTKQNSKLAALSNSLAIVLKSCIQTLNLRTEHLRSFPQIVATLTSAIWKSAFYKGEKITNLEKTYNNTVGILSNLIDNFSLYKEMFTKETQNFIDNVKTANELNKIRSSRASKIQTTPTKTQTGFIGTARSLIPFIGS